MHLATHICGICGALWRRIPDGDPYAGWNLRPGRPCGACCDNAPMDQQIVELSEVDEMAATLDVDRTEAAAVIYADRQVKAEREARGNCGRCRHYRPDPEAGRNYFGEPNADSGWCTQPDNAKGAREGQPGIDMLSGDWCQSFEVRS